MSRYIDADKLRKDEISRCHCVPCVGSNDNNYKDLDEVLNEAPTADVVEVRHAEWELIEKEDFIYEIRKCSACGAERFFEEDDKLCNFCPDCGAKMDGERREDDGKS